MIRVKPSIIEGVGLFAECDIPKHTRVMIFQEDDYFFRQSFTGVDTLLRERFCLKDIDGYHCPLSFSCMSIGWLINHSDNPNGKIDGDFFVAIQDILQGEELTVDYHTLEN